jgi:glycosyltransferase involved in cell wall biosynthesis
MKILLCHNYYQQTGGEDHSFADERDLLTARGHHVVTYTRHNEELNRMSRLSAAAQSVWSRQTYRELKALIRRERPEIMHCTNSFPLISPAAHYAARDAGVAVVQALRNYRFMCPAALLMRQGRICEDCLGKRIAWPAALHGCYRGSRAGSLVVSGMLALHRAWNTWERTVDRFFTLTHFARDKFAQAGFDPGRIDVKPNCVAPDPGLGGGEGGYAVFVGRLSPEKGIDTLLSAWSQLKGRVPLKIIGDGPCADAVRKAAGGDPRIEYLGKRPLEEVYQWIGDAALLVMPSVWYETFGRTIIEAYAKGTPVVASRLGAMAELVDHQRTGLLHQAGDPVDLAAQVQRLLDDRRLRKRLRHAGRCEYEQKYTPQRSVETLLDIYARALGGTLEPHDGEAGLDPAGPNAPSTCLVREQS